MTTTRTPATYEQIINSPYLSQRMDEYAEFGEFNYTFTQLILDELDAYDNGMKSDKVKNEWGMEEHPELPIDPESLKKIRGYAERIMKRGGLQALQMNYYTMINFCVVKHMDEENPDRRILYSKVNELKYLLSGCKGGGDVWRY
tara:strand:+ start:3595 stop:4026 length:432 start_codon:yes stop_codon:yes gene_type:complete